MAVGERPETEYQPERDELELEARDPVCGRDVVLTRAPVSLDYAGTTYYFCSAECLQDFERAPEQYLGTDDRRL